MEEKIRMMLSGKDSLHCPGFEDGSRRSWQPQELEGQGGRYSLEPPGDVQAWWHLDCSPRKPLKSADLHNCKVIQLVVLSLCWFVTMATGNQYNSGKSSLTGGGIQISCKFLKKQAWSYDNPTQLGDLSIPTVPCFFYFVFSLRQEK